MAILIMTSCLKQQANIFRMALLGLTILLLWGEMRQVEAGCQRFGHSCFGAHGKRGDIPPYGNRADIPTGMELSDALTYNSQPIRPSDYEAAPVNYQPINRISPYLLDWIMSAHRGEMRQPLQIPRQQDQDISIGESRRK